MGSGFACMLITGSGICCPEATFFAQSSSSLRACFSTSISLSWR